MNIRSFASLSSLSYLVLHDMRRADLKPDQMVQVHARTGVSFSGDDTVVCHYDGVQRSSLTNFNPTVEPRTYSSEPFMGLSFVLKIWY